MSNPTLTDEAVLFQNSGITCQGKNGLSFIKRPPELSVRFASNIKRKQAQIVDDTITEYFTHLGPELANVPPSNIWNYDETNSTDDPGNKRIITKRGAKYPE